MKTSKRMKSKSFPYDKQCGFYQSRVTASLPLKGQVNKHTTVKLSVIHSYVLLYRWSVSPLHERPGLSVHGRYVHP